MELMMWCGVQKKGPWAESKEREERWVGVWVGGGHGGIAAAIDTLFVGIKRIDHSMACLLPGTPRERQESSAYESKEDVIGQCRKRQHRTLTRQSLPRAAIAATLSVDTLFAGTKTARDIWATEKFRADSDGQALGFRWRSLTPRPLKRRLALQRPRNGSLSTSCSGRVCF